MNCMAFRKFTQAFADGELDVEQNLTALEHLNMCPDCARRVVEITSLKAALERIWDRPDVQSGLPNPIESALANETATPLTTAMDSIARASDNRAGRHTFGRRAVRMFPILAAAAAILFVVAVWRNFPRTSVTPSGSMTVLARRAVEDIRQTHTQFSFPGATLHHDASLSRDLPTIASRLGERLDLNVHAPDLSSYGFSLASGNQCFVEGRRAAHILYRETAARLVLSIFTLPYMPELRPSGITTLGDSDYFVSSDVNFTLMAWHEGRQTYVACGEIEEDPLARMAKSIRTAAGHRRTTRTPQLATLRLFD